MSLNALLALRAALMADAGINDYCNQIYGRPPTHFVGYKRAANANDYPVLSYVPLRTRGDGSINEHELVGVIIGVNESAIEDYVMQGHVRVAAIADLLIAAIRTGLIGDRTLFVNDWSIIGDMGERHPFYELELQLPLIWRRQ